MLGCPAFYPHFGRAKGADGPVVQPADVQPGAMLVQVRAQHQPWIRVGDEVGQATHGRFVAPVDTQLDHAAVAVFDDVVDEGQQGGVGQAGAGVVVGVRVGVELLAVGSFGDGVAVGVDEPFDGQGELVDEVVVVGVVASAEDGHLNLVLQPFQVGFFDALHRPGHVGRGVHLKPGAGPAQGPRELTQREADLGAGRHLLRAGAAELVHLVHVPFLGGAVEALPVGGEFAQFTHHVGHDGVVRVQVGLQHLGDGVQAKLGRRLVFYSQQAVDG